LPELNVWLQVSHHPLELSEVDRLVKVYPTALEASESFSDTQPSSAN
jgi:hypothetical protein